MEFDQAVKWDNALVNQFFLSGKSGKVAAGSVDGNTVILKLVAASSAQDLTYINGQSWSHKTLLRGANGIAALTFCEVPIAPVKAIR